MINNVKKILIYIIVVLVIAAACFFAGYFYAYGKLSETNKQSIIDAVQSGVDNLAEYERSRDEIDIRFRETISELERINRDREETLNQRQGLIDQRERELGETNRIIERLSNINGSAQGSISRLEQIHRELEKRNNEDGEQNEILEDGDFD